MLPRDLELRVLALWAGVLGIDSAVLDVDGLVVVTDPRDFAVDRRAVVRTARGVLVLAAPADARVAAADPAAFVREVEARPRGVGLMHYLAAVSRPMADTRVRRLAPEDQHLLDELLRTSGPEATAEADVSVDHPVAVGIVEDDRLLAVASLLDMGHGTVDVGVLVHPQARRRGLGAAVVSAVANRAGGRLVQYRCDRENEASAQLARACGFVLWGILQVAPRAAG